MSGLENELLSQHGPVDRSVVYSNKNAFRSRSDADKLALQGIPQLLQCVLSPTSLDIGIDNAEFTIISQLVDKVCVQDKSTWQPYIDTINELASLADVGIFSLGSLNCSVVVGRAMLLNAFRGNDHTHADPVVGAELKRVFDAGCFYQLLALSLIPSATAAAMTSVPILGSNCSACSGYLWRAIEDHIMSTWLNDITPSSSVHLSHHHDSLRMDRSIINSAAVLEEDGPMGDQSDSVIDQSLRLFEMFIRQGINFTVQLSLREHRCVEDLLGELGGVTPAPVDQRVLVAQGNCIPLALTRVKGWTVVPLEILSALEAEVSASQPDPLETRSYHQCQKIFGLNLMGSLDIANGKLSQWLIHTNNYKKGPHCFALEFCESGNIATIWNRETKYETDWTILEGLLKSSVDHMHISYFLVCDSGHSPFDGQQSLELLELRAGAGTSKSTSGSKTRSVHNELLADPSDLAGAHDSEDEAVVHVDAVLRTRLKSELDKTLRLFDKQKADKRATCVNHGWACGLCPDYYTDRVSYFAAHLKRHKTAPYGILSGFKQLKCVKGFFDHDTIVGTLRRDYLRRSAQAVNVTSVPGVVVDRAIKLVLDVSGPRFVPMATRAVDDQLRCVGYTYYSRGFANQLLSNAMYVDGRLSKLRPLFIRQARDCECELWSLIPIKVDVWAKLCEDVFFSPSVLTILDALHEQCHRFNEYMYLQMDCTVRVAFNIRGQGSYRDSCESRALEAFGDDEALHRACVVRGRTGAVLHLDLVASEESSKLVDALRASIPERYRPQTVIIAVDNACFKLLGELQQLFCCLKFLLLDPIHLVIVYKQCFGNKMSAGMVVLRVIMNKFNKIDLTKHHSYWGDAHPCALSQRSDPRVSIMRNKILKGSMPFATAKRIIIELNPDTPWYTPIEFVETMSAFTALYRHEHTRKTHIKSKKLYVVLWSATDNDRVQWYFNNIRARHWMPSQYQSIAASGTSAVESLNHELNSWFSNMPEVYAATLRLELHINMVKKLMTHNVAMYSPQLRQLSQQTIATASHSNDRISRSDWNAWCISQVGLGDAAGMLPLHKAKVVQRRRVLVHERARPKKHITRKYYVMRRPAALKRPAAVMPTAVVNYKVANKKVKRHAFNLKRVKQVGASTLQASA